MLSLFFSYFSQLISAKFMLKNKVLYSLFSFFLNKFFLFSFMLCFLQMMIVFFQGFHQSVMILFTQLFYSGYIIFNIFKVDNLMSRLELKTF